MSDKSRRLKKVEKELRQIISSYLVKQQAGSRQNLISVTQVVASPDLRRAKVYLSMLGETEVSEEVLEDVQSHAKSIQSEISRQLPMKYCPKLFFYNDVSVGLFAKLDSTSSLNSQE